MKAKTKGKKKSEKFDPTLVDLRRRNAISVLNQLNDHGLREVANIMYQRGIQEQMVQTRREMGYTQEHVASKMGMQVGYLRKLETEKYPDYTMNTLGIWSRALGLSAEFGLLPVRHEQDVLKKTPPSDSDGLTPGGGDVGYVKVDEPFTQADAEQIKKTFTDYPLERYPVDGQVYMWMNDSLEDVVKVVVIHAFEANGVQKVTYENKDGGTRTTDSLDYWLAHVRKVEG